MPGQLEHASGEVEEFDAALISGADGQVAESDRDAAQGNGEVIDEDDELAQAELEAEALARPPAVPDEPAGSVGGGGTLTARRPAALSREERAGRENRVVGFLRASWAELQRVQWPDRRQVAQATAVVLGFVAVAGVFLGVADWLAGKIVDAIL